MLCVLSILSYMKLISGNFRPTFTSKIDKTHNIYINLHVSCFLTRTKKEIVYMVVFHLIGIRTMIFLLIYDSYAFKLSHGNLFLH